MVIRKTGGVEFTVPVMVYPVLGQTVSAFVSLPGRYVPVPFADLATVGWLALSGFCRTLLMIAACHAAAWIVVAPTQHSQIGWAVLFGAEFLAEPMTAGMAAGMGIIALAGLLVVARQERSGRKTA